MLTLAIMFYGVCFEACLFFESYVEEFAASYCLCSDDTEEFFVYIHDHEEDIPDIVQQPVDYIEPP